MDLRLAAVRRIAVIVTIAAFSLAALLGIIALLAGGEFGTTQQSILFTTFLVGALSVAMLCFLAVADSRFWALGIFGAATSLVPFTVALLVVWADMSPSDATWKAAGVCLTLAATTAQLCLLVALRGTSKRMTALVLGVTITAVVVAVLIVIPLITESDPGAGYWRTFGVIAILDALGSVTFVALRFFRPAHQPQRFVVAVDAALGAKISAAAQRAGVSESALVTRAVREYVERPMPPHE